MAERHGNLGQRIKQARDDKKWKQKELAAAVHVEPLTVSRWETGKHAPDVGMLQKIAVALEKPTTFFVTPPPDPELGERGAAVLERLDQIDLLVREVRTMMEEKPKRPPVQRPGTP